MHLTIVWDHDEGDNGVIDPQPLRLGSLLQWDYGDKLSSLNIETGCIDREPNMIMLQGSFPTLLHCNWKCASIGGQMLAPNLMSLILENDCDVRGSVLANLANLQVLELKAHAVDLKGCASHRLLKRLTMEASAFWEDGYLTGLDSCTYLKLDLHWQMSASQFHLEAANFKSMSTATSSACITDGRLAITLAADRVGVL